MEETHWQALVRRLEPVARSNPAAYRRRVIALAALGYALVAGMLVILLGLAALVVVIALHGGMVLAVKLAIPICALLSVVGGSLYVRFEQPDGLLLMRKDVPELFRMIDDVRREIRGPRVHDVLLDGKTNAWITQMPRAGGVFGSHNYLVLGLPYLAALSKDELRAVVGHELGHLSRKHGRFGTFVYRVEARWAKLLEGFEANESMWTRLVRRFVLWYAPYFKAYAFPALRAHEFEADDAAATVAGRPAAATALVSGTVAARWSYESYWPTIYDRAIDEPAPPSAAFAPMAQQIPQAKQSPDLEHWYRDLLEIETDVTDSHPSLAERLAHLEVDPREVFALATQDGSPSAAACYLGDAQGQLVAELDRAWRDAVASEWSAQHADAQREKAELEKLEARDSLSADEGLRRAQLTEAFRGPEPALVRYRELVETENDALARYAIGRLLLAHEDDEGLRWLDDAIERDPEAVIPACELAYAYLHAHARDEEAGAYARRREEHAELLEAAAIERSEVSVDDQLEPPDLPDELLEQVVQTVVRHKEVARAYLVRKRTKHFDDTLPFFVLGIVPKSYSRTEWKDADHDRETLVDRIAGEISLPVEVIVVQIHKDSPLVRRFAQLDRACLFDGGS